MPKIEVIKASEAPPPPPKMTKQAAELFDQLTRLKKVELLDQPFEPLGSLAQGWRRRSSVLRSRFRGRGFRAVPPDRLRADRRRG